MATAVSPLPLLALLVVLFDAACRAQRSRLRPGLGGRPARRRGGTVALLGGGAGSDEGEVVPRAIEVVAGGGLVVLAVRQWGRRPRGDARMVDPGWLVVADRCTPPRAFALGNGLALANPKNLVLTVAVAGSAAGASSASQEQFLALV